MKKITVILAAFALTIFSNELLAQAKANTANQNQEVKKVVTYDNHKGKKVLSISTTIDGKKTTETYEGKQAEQKMKELEAEAKQAKNISQVEANGKKIITIEEEKTVTKSK